MSQIDIPGDPKIMDAIEAVRNHLQVSLGVVNRSQVVRESIMAMNKRKSRITQSQWIDLHTQYMQVRGTEKRLIFTPNDTDKRRLREIVEFSRSNAQISDIIRSDHGQDGFPLRMFVIFAILFNAAVHTAKGSS